MLKPSEKMLAQLASDEPIDYSIDSIPLDFASQSQYSDPDLEQLFTEDRARTLYIYKINNLVKTTKQKPTLNYSQNSVKIGFIDKDEYIKIIGYEISDFNFKLQIQQNTTVQDNSTSYVMIDEKDILINDISKENKEFLETLDLKIVSFNESITENNKNECYIIEEYKRPYSLDGINVINSTHLVKITDFKWKNQNSIHLVLQKPFPENTVFTGIQIKYPKSILFGNIKCWGNDNGVYSYPQSIVKDASLVPLLSMPIETNPNVRIFQYWFTESFLPWSITKDYIQGKDILDLVKGKGLEKVLLNYLTYCYNYDRKFQGAKYDDKGNPTNKSAQLRQKFEGQKPEDVIDGLFENWKLSNPTSINENAVKRFKQIIYMLSNYTYSKYAINKGYNDDFKIISSYYFKLLSIPQQIEVGYWEFENCIIKLQSSYFNFIVEDESPTLEKNNWKQVYAGNKPFNKIDNKWYFVIWRGNKNNDWRIGKFQNSEKIRLKRGFKLVLDYYGKVDDPNKINLVFDAEINNLRANDQIWTSNSINFKSVYRWDGVDEPNKPFISPATGVITYWRLEIFKTSDYHPIYKIEIINNDISENKVYQLEANYFNWLSITNELETNNIPSLIPGEIKLSDGEYGKYLTNLIVSSENLEKLLNLFSSTNKNIYSKSNWVEEILNINNTNIEINFSKTLLELNKIELSGIWGYGNYDITIFAETNERIIQGKDVTLELLQSLPIGTNIVEEIKKTEPTAVNFKLVENNKWDVRIKDSIDYFSNNVLFRVLNTNLERDKMFLIPFLEKINININNLQLFNKNNEKLSLITLEI